MLTQSFVSKLLNLKKSSRVVLIFSLILLCASIQTHSVCKERKRPTVIILSEDPKLDDMSPVEIQSPFHSGKLPRRDGPPFDDDAGTPVGSPGHNKTGRFADRPEFRPGPPFDND